MGRVGQTVVQIKNHLYQKGDRKDQEEIDYRETADLFTFYAFTLSLSLSLSGFVNWRFEKVKKFHNNIIAFLISNMDAFRYLSWREEF